MANVTKHRFVSSIADSGDTTEVRPSDWNREHDFGGGTHGDILLRNTGASDGASWLASVVAGQVLVSQGAAALPAWSSGLTLLGIVFPLTDPASPADGQFWIVCSGVSPSRTWAMKLRDGGVTRTLISGGY